jgi:hypothetical protein
VELERERETNYVSCLLGLDRNEKKKFFYLKNSPSILSARAPAEVVAYLLCHFFSSLGFPVFTAKVPFGKFPLKWKEKLCKDFLLA